MTSVHFHANVHVCGYLPDSDITTHQTAREAWSHLADEIERAWDGDYEILADHDIDGRMLADDRFMPAHTFAHSASEAGWTATHERSARRLPLIFEVTECDGCDWADNSEPERFDVHNVTACLCCALVASNGECCPEGEHQGREPLSFLMPGEVLTVEGDAYFSWRPCLSCGSGLGGDRFDATILNPCAEVSA